MQSLTGCSASRGTLVRGCRFEAKGASQLLEQVGDLHGRLATLVRDGEDLFGCDG